MFTYLIAGDSPDPPANLKQDLLSWWALESAGAPLVDSVGNHNLPLAGGPPGSSTGKVGNCGEFNGTNEMYYDTSGNTAAFDITTGAMSAACWVRPDSWTTGEGPFGRRTTDDGWAFVATAGGNWGAQFNATVIDSGVSIKTDGSWQFLAMWKDPSGNEMGISVDAGTPATTTHFNLTSAVYTLSIGRSYSSYFDGGIDEVAFWTKALTSSEISALYNSGNGVTYGDL